MKRIADGVTRVVSIESLERRTLMSGTEALSDVLIPQSKTGNLVEAGDSATYTFHLATPGWISVDFEGYFVGSGPNSLELLDSKGDILRYGGRATLPKIDDLAAESRKNQLPAGDYSIVLTRTYPALNHPNTAYTMRFVAAYAGTNVTLAPDEGDDVPGLSNAALEGYLGTVGNLLMQTTTTTTGLMPPDLKP